jgi:3',5'-cyclic AMP phosphodiesterase CpdA
MKALSLALGVIAGTCLAQPMLGAAETARGVVFEDANGDGRRGPEEPGVPEVAVSNGREVVATDADGRYAIPIRDGDTLFITKPSGWSVPVDADRLPQFFYHHAPAGAPGGWRPRYRGLEPSGPLPAAVDFPLQRSAEPERFRAILFADTQPLTADEVDFIRDDAVAELVRADAAFGLTLGDIAYDDLSLLPRIARTTGRIGVPWYHVPGNHDMNYLAPDDAESLLSFRRHFGPAYYSFDYGRTHVVVLDTVEYLGTSRGAADADPLGAGSYRGAIGERQLAWLAADLARVPADRLIVLAMHIPLVSPLDPGAPGINVGDRRRLLELVSGREHLLALAGHMHLVEHSYLGAEEGFAGPGALHLHTLAAVSGSWWSGPLDERGVPVSLGRDGTPRGYFLLEVDGTAATVRFQPTGRPSSHQMRITLDPGFPRLQPAALRDVRHGELLGGRVELAQLFSTEILVNLFDGGPRSLVSATVDDRPPVVMERSLRADPFVQELFQRAAATLRPWVEPVPSTHLWAAPLPDDLAPGLHTITVRALDEYGREHRAHKLFEVYALAENE